MKASFLLPGEGQFTVRSLNLLILASQSMSVSTTSYLTLVYSVLVVYTAAIMSDSQIHTTSYDICKCVVLNLAPQINDTLY